MTMKRMAACILAVILTATGILMTLTSCTSECNHATLIAHPEVASTCTEEGTAAYWECEKCGALFSDAKGKHSIVKPQTVAKAPHTCTAWEIGETAHTGTCTVCGRTVTEEHTYVPVEGENVGHLYATSCVCGHGGEYAPLAAVNIRTAGGTAVEGDKDSAPYYDCTVKVENCEDACLTAALTAEIRVRGNYTAEYEKKPYKIRFTEKQSLLGLNDGHKFRNWVLLAEYKDRSLLRNATALYLGNALFPDEDGYYCSDYRFVEVYVNGVYEGLYLLAEQQQVNSHRIDIAEPEADYTGTDIGYLVEYDYYADTETDPLKKFVLDYRGDLVFSDGTTAAESLFPVTGYTIQSDIYSQAQRDYIAACLQSIYDIVYDAVYTDHTDLTLHPYLTLAPDGSTMGAPAIRTAQAAVEAVVDTESLARMLIMQELCMDPDSAVSSFYLSFDNGATGKKKLVFEAPWDWDSALGFSIPETNIPYTTTAYTGAATVTTARDKNPWLVLTANEEWFMNIVSAAWDALTESGATDEALRRIDAYTDAYAVAIARNYTKWAECLTAARSNACPAYCAANTQESAAAYLKDFLSARITYLNRIF